MPISNPYNFLTQSSRSYNTDTTYMNSLVSDRGTVSAATSIITFNNLEVELEGNRFRSAIRTLNFAPLTPLLTVGSTYGVYAVAQFLEPATQSAAELLSVDYFVQANANGEAIAFRYFPSNIQAVIDAAGGINRVKSAYFSNPSPAIINAYNAYYEALERLQQPRYLTTSILPVGYDFVLAELVYQDNTSSNNVFPSKTRAEFRVLRSQLGELNTRRRIISTTEAAAAFSARPWLVKTARSYATLANAQSDSNGTDITGAVQLADSTGVNYTFAAASFFVIQEFILVGNTNLGQIHTGFTPVRWLDRQSTLSLGRLNPIYLDNNTLLTSINSANKPASRLTPYQNPASLVRVTWDGTAVTALTANYDTGF